MKAFRIFAIITVLSILFALAFPFLVDFLYTKGIEDPIIITSYTNQDALSYGGDIIGSVIGGSVTLLGVIWTIVMQREDQKEENIRLVKPLLRVTEGDYDYKHKYIQFDANLTDESRNRPRKDIANTAHITVNIKNEGQRELIDLHGGNFSGTFFDEGGKYYQLCPIIYSGDLISINFFMYEKGIYDKDLHASNLGATVSPLSFTFYYKDCLGNQYAQEFSISLLHSITKETPAEECALNISIERVEIKNAPQLIDAKKLPWEVGENLLVQC